jgi:fibronectin type 3 domain-containing protein
VSWGTNGVVKAVVHIGNTVVVGGTFTQIADNGGAGSSVLPRSNIAAFDATTGAPLQGWAPSIDGEVDALAVSADGTKVYAGGDFATANGLPRTRLVALDAATGSVDPTWQPTAGAKVRALVVAGTRVYLGGSFGVVSGKSRKFLAAVDGTTGFVDPTWQPSADAAVRGLTVSPDLSRVYAVGDFTTMSTLTRKNVASLDAVTGAVLDWHPDPGYSVLAVAADATAVYTAGGGSKNTLAAWDATTAAKKWSKTSDGDFQAVGIAGPILYAGGHFLFYDGHDVPKRIVAVDASTGILRPDWLPVVDGSFNPDGSLGVWGMSIYDGTRLAIGGDFTRVGGSPHQGFAQFTGDVDGPPDLTPPSDPANLVAGAVGGSKVVLRWMASADDVGTSGYKVFRNGTQLATVGQVGYTDEAVQPNTTYTYQVQAFDSANHQSAPSNTATVRTGPPDQVLTFTPTDDTYADSAFPTKNFGTSTSLKVDGSPIKDFFLKFAVSGTQLRQIVSAKLRLYCTDSSNDGGHFYLIPDNSWSEGTLTWNSAPAAQTTEAAEFSDVSAGNSYTLDLSNVITGDGTYGFRVKSPVTNGAEYGSKEGVAGQGPQLLVSVATAAALPFADTFETGDLSQWTTATGIGVQQQEVFAGQWAARATATGSPAYAYKQLTQAQSDLYYQLRFKPITQGANSAVLQRVWTAGGSPLIKLYLDSSGKLVYRNDVAQTSSTSLNAPAKGKWHTLQLHTLVNGTASKVEVWLDGTKISALSKTESLGTTPIGRVQFGDDASGRSFDVAFDDVVLDSSFIADTTPPLEPTGLTGTAASPHEVDLTWNAASDDIGVTGYQIYRDGSLLATVGAVTQYADKTAPAGTTSSYAVRAVDAAGNYSGSSDAVSVTTPPADTSPPSTPTGLTAVAVSFNRVDLSWAAASDDTGVTGYTVYRNGQQLVSLGGSTTRYQDTTVAPSTTYSYTVDAVDAVGNRSARSDAASATTPASALFRDGFESGDLSQWTSPGVVTAQQQQTFAGSWAARATSTGGGASAYVQLSQAQSELYYQLHFKVISQGANSVILDRVRTSSGTSLVKVYLDSSGKLAYRNDISGATATSSTVVGSGSWHTLQLHTLVGTSGQVDVWLDGTKITALSRTESLGTTPVGRLDIGDTTTGRTFDVAFDEVVADAAFIPDTTPPSKPTGLTATAASAQEVDLAWNAATDDIGVTGYKIYRNGSLLTTTGPVTTYADTSVAGSTTYTYTVRASDGTNDSPESDPASATTPSGDTTPPSQPAALAATAVSFDRVDLSWGAASDDVGVTGYTVYRNGQPLASVDGSTTRYSDKTVVPSTTYTYTVDAVDAAKNRSPQSDPASATTPPPAVFRDGFESGDLSQWTSGSGITVQQAAVFSGAWAARGTVSGGAASVYRQLAQPQTELVYRVRFDLLSQGANSVVLARLRTAAGGSLVKVYVDGGGRLAYRNDVSGSSVTSSLVVAPGVWHTLQLHALVSSAGQVDVSLDGSGVAGLSRSESLGTTPAGRVELGDNTGGRTFDVAFDDVVVGVPPSNTSPPTLTGSAVVGNTLTADTGTWAGTAPLSYAYQWRRCDSSGGACVDIAGATASSYTLTADDGGATIRVAVTATNEFGSATASSAASTVVTT